MLSNMSTIMCLPMEIIINILSYVDISIEDVVNFIHTWERWHYAIHNLNHFWKKKFFERWPTLKSIYVNYMIHKRHINFKEEVKASIIYRMELWRCVSQMSGKYYHKNEVSDIDIKDCGLLFDPEKAYPMSIYFLLDELEVTIKQGITSFGDKLDLTQEYYAKKLYSYLRRYQQRNEWQKFKNSNEQILERAATIVSQWCQPGTFISYSRVSKCLDDITQQVLELLRKRYPVHLIFSVSTEQLSFWKHNNINDNQWNSEEGHQIMNCIEDILHDFNYFIGENSGNIQNYIFIPQENLIDFALETNIGNNITIPVIFACVARRLGISCNLEFASPSFLLTWKSKDLIAENSTYHKCFYLNPVESIRNRKKNHSEKYRIKNCLSYNPEITCEKVITRTINIVSGSGCLKTFRQSRLYRIDYERSLLELRHLIQPNNIDAIRDLGYYYEYHGMNLSDLIVALEKMNAECNKTPLTIRDYDRLLTWYQTNELLSYYKMVNMEMAKTAMHFSKMIPKRRTNEIRFLVGEFVKFSFNGLCTIGVITGWDKDYDPHVASRTNDWYMNRETSSRSKKSASVRLLSHPFYTILNGAIRMFYVPQVILKNIHTLDFSHNILSWDQIGRYFCTVRETHCVPNWMLANHYPDDFEILCVKYN